MLFSLSNKKDDHSNKLEILYKKYYKDMYRVANNILKDTYLTEDAIHNAFIKMIDYLDSIEDTDCKKTRGFVVIIVRSAAIDLYRKKKSTIPFEDVQEYIPDKALPIDDRLIKTETFDLISSYIKELHTSYADIITLKYFYHFTDNEIAKMLGISKSNVRVRLHRARQNLLKIFTDNGVSKDG